MDPTLPPNRSVELLTVNKQVGNSCNFRKKNEPIKHASYDAATSLMYCGLSIDVSPSEKRKNIFVHSASHKFLRIMFL